MEGSTAHQEQDSNPDHIFYKIIDNHTIQVIETNEFDVSFVVDSLDLTFDELKAQHAKPKIAIKKQEHWKIRISLIGVHGPKGEESF